MLSMIDDPAPRDLLGRFVAVRRRSMALAAPLGVEDQCVQSMPEASPTKWHLAHTTWFFESTVLCTHVPGYQVIDAKFDRLFNSHRETSGRQHPLSHKGMLTRPTLPEVLSYRMSVDQSMVELLSGASRDPTLIALIELGLQHEQQHQELMLTDILHAMYLNPSRPAVLEGQASGFEVPAVGAIEYAGGTVQIGHGKPGFAFDIEGPRHSVELAPYALSRRLVTNAEYQIFVEDGGYRRKSWWTADGWAAVQAESWKAPLYWLDEGLEFTLHGEQPRQPEQPVRHLSFFEAAAYAEWAGVRLPTEFEWEAAVGSATPPDQAFGVAWQWTRSPYAPFPRYCSTAMSVAEGNEDFMLRQLVLRGSSSATPPGHARVTYRHLLLPSARWHFTGLRLARDL